MAATQQIERMRTLPRGAACVYCMGDPESREVRYIGVTNSPQRRFREHVNRALSGSGGDTHAYRWIRYLGRFGLRPVFRVLCVVQDMEEAKRLERVLLKTLRPQLPLTNGTDGGDGMANPTAETRSRLSAASLAMTTEQLRKRGEAISRAFRSDPERRKQTNKKIGDALRGKPKSEEHRLQIRARMKKRRGLPGRPHTEESKARMRVVQKLLAAKRCG